MGLAVETLTEQERHNLNVVLEFISLEKPLSPENSARLRKPDYKIGRIGLAGVKDLTGFQGSNGFVKTSITQRTDSVRDFIVQADTVWVLGELSGKHSDPIFGIPATHRWLRVSELLFFKLEDGKIAEHSFMIDELDFLRQIGAKIELPPLSHRQ